MANGTKEYKIVINGLTESIDAVKSLNEQLNGLEAKINALGSKAVNVDLPSTKDSSIKENIELQKELNRLKKEEAAENRLAADEYANTLKGMKQELADIKAVMQNVDLGDTDKMDKLVRRANELNGALKKVEESYGQFGRNVGNYKSAADGFKNFAIEVNGVTKEFNTAKQALKELKAERDTLSAKKDMGLISEEEAKRLQGLIPIVAQLQSSIQDAGKPMDALMDTMQSLVAMAQVSKGFSALFGFDDSEIQRSIQQLLALQNALQGLQTIQKQLQTGEGIGQIFKVGDEAIKSFTDKLFGVDKTAKAASASVANVGTAGKTAATGLGTASVAATTTAKSFSVASAAATALRVVLNALGIGLVIGAISLLVSGVGKLIDKQQEAKKYQEDLNNAINEGNKEYAKASLEMSTLEKRLNSFNGTKKQEKKLVDELNRKYGDSIGQYKSVKEWKEAIIKKADAYAKALRTEAEAQAYLNMYTKQFLELEEAKQRQEQKDSSWIGWLEKAVDTVAKGVTKINKSWGALAVEMSAGIHTMFDDNIVQMQANLEKTKKLYDQKTTELQKIQEENKIGDNAETIEENGKKTKDAVKKLENEINQLELRLMEDGLNKRLRQLDEEERQTINKIKKNGKNVGDEILKVQRTYAALRLKEIKEYLAKLEETISASANEIRKIQFSLDISNIDNQIDELQNKFKELSEDVPLNNELLTNAEFRTLVNTKGLETASRDINAFVYNSNAQLDNFFSARYNTTKDFYEKAIKLLKENIKQQSELEEKRIKKQEEQERDAEGERYSNQMSALTKTKKDVEDGLKAIVDRYGEITKEGAIVVEQTNKKISEETVQHYRDLEGQLQEIEAQIAAAKKQHKDKLEEITKESNNAIKKNEIDTLNEIKAAQERYYNQQLSNYRDFLSKINNEANKNPVADKNWGIVNIPQTKKNYNEIINASKEALREIEGDKEKLEKDFNDGFIGKEAYNATKNQLNDLEKDIRNAQAATEQASSYLVADFVQSIQKYLQEALNSFNQIMSSVWDAQDIAFDKEQEQLDKELEMLEDNLNKQEQLVSDYKSNINSIENELATSRGDRRQHLIDQLNAEMEAERAAYKEKQRLEKLEEANKRKQDELEKKRRKAQYHRDLLQAAVNGAMAVTYASMNAWPIPAIPLMSMAAAASAAQLAIMASNKPYAKGGQLDGGVAVGNRHRDGGIKVLGGRAEIEGGEFITNRLTTEKNINLLEYINSKKKRIDINDLVEFYSSGSIKKNIMKMSPKSKFADGGYIPPTLSTTIEIEDKLLDSFERYSNRPVVVSVVDITSKQDDVRRVQTLAGL